VTPDAALYALWSLVLWLGVRLLRRGLTTGRVLALFAAVGAACLVKATSYALLPGAVAVLAVALWRARSGPGAARALVAAGAGLALTVGLWVLVAQLVDRPTSPQLSAAATTSGLNVRWLLSYVWQFYLPPTPLQTDIAAFGGDVPAYEIWIKGAWAAFGWLEVDFPEPVYVLLAVVTVAVAAAAGLALWRGRRGADLAVGAFFVLVAGTLLAGLHWTEYRQVINHGSTLNQGRYLLPLVGIAGAAVALALRALPASRRGAGLAVVVGGLIVLQLFSLGLVLGRFYA
jgi:hypothetical protein